MYSHLNNKLSQERIHEIIKDAVKIEQVFGIIVFIERILNLRHSWQSPCPWTWLGWTVASCPSTSSSSLTTCSSSWNATRLGSEMELPRIIIIQLFNVKNPFDFMENISIEGKTNFFEKKVCKILFFSGRAIIKFTTFKNMAELKNDTKLPTIPSWLYDVSI